MLTRIDGVVGSHFGRRYLEIVSAIHRREWKCLWLWVSSLGRDDLACGRMWLGEANLAPITCSCWVFCGLETTTGNDGEGNANANVASDDWGAEARGEQDRIHQVGTYCHGLFGGCLGDNEEICRVGQIGQRGENGRSL